jgi:hypothetical protein
VKIYIGFKPLLREKAHMTIIVKNVKKGGKFFPLAWDLARELGKVYVLKDEKYGCKITNHSRHLVSEMPGSVTLFIIIVCSFVMNKKTELEKPKPFQTGIK